MSFTNQITNSLYSSNAGISPVTKGAFLSASVPSSSTLISPSGGAFLLGDFILTTAGALYYLQSVSTVNGVTSATWTLIQTSGGGGGGILPVANGGTGNATLTAHGVLIGEGTSPIAVTSAGTLGQPLVSGGASADPSFSVLGVVGGGTGVATVSGLVFGNGTSAVTGISPTVTSGSAGSPQVLNTRAGNITFTGVSIAAGATLTLTNTNSSITSGSTQILWSMSGATTGSALTMQSVTPNTGTVAYVVTNGTGATTSTANITIQFLILN